MQRVMPARTGLCAWGAGAWGWHMGLAGCALSAWLQTRHPCLHGLQWSHRAAKHIRFRLRNGSGKGHEPLRMHFVPSVHRQAAHGWPGMPDAQGVPSGGARPERAGHQTHECGFHPHPAVVMPLPQLVRLGLPTWRWSRRGCAVSPLRSRPDSWAHHRACRPKTHVAYHPHRARSGSMRQEHQPVGH